MTLALVALLPVVAAKANVFDPLGVDPRVIQPQVGAFAIFAPVVRLETDVRVDSKEGDEETNFSGSGFLVSPCLVMTNAHVITEIDSEVTGITVRVVTGNGFETREIPGTVEMIGSAYLAADMTRDDWGLVRLEDCVGAELGWFDFANLSTDELLDSVVEQAGFPGDRDAAVMWLSPDCRLYPVTQPNDRDGLYHDCALTSGSSGSAIYVRTEAGPRVVGIAEAEYPGWEPVLPRYRDRVANVAVDIRYVLREAGAVIKADRVGVENPLDALGWPDGTGVDLAAEFAEELERHGCLATAGLDLEQAAAQFNLVTGQDTPSGGFADAPADWARVLEAVRHVPAPACIERAIAPLALDAVVEGALGVADNIDLYGTFADCYVLEIDADADKSPVTIDLAVQSKTFDTYLEIGEFESAAHCGTVALDYLNDDSGSSTNSRLTLDLKPSVYLVRVTSIFPEEVGEYVLTVR